MGQFMYGDNRSTIKYKKNDKFHLQYKKKNRFLK